MKRLVLFLMFLVMVLLSGCVQAPQYSPESISRCIGLSGSINEVIKVTNSRSSTWLDFLVVSSNVNDMNWTSEDINQTLAPGESLEIAVSFFSNEMGIFNTTLEINADGVVKSIPLEAEVKQRVVDCV